MMKHMLVKVYFDGNDKDGYRKFHIINQKFAELGCKIINLPRIDSSPLNNVVKIQEFMETTETRRALDLVEDARVKGIFKVLLPIEKVEEYVEWSKYQNFKTPAYYIKESEQNSETFKEVEKLLLDIHGDSNV